MICELGTGKKSREMPEKAPLLVFSVSAHFIEMEKKILPCLLETAGSLEKI